MAAGATLMIEQERIQALNRPPGRGGKYVLYWMQASQRAEWNHALELAIAEANTVGLPVVVFFGLTDRFPEANLRHYAFMLEGLVETRSALEVRGIKLVARLGSPDDGAIEMARQAALVVTDRGYLRVQRAWRERAAAAMACPLVQVETDVVVPVEAASAKEEYAAATLRPRIKRQIARYLRPVRQSRVKRESLGLAIASLDVADRRRVLGRLKIDRAVGPVAGFRGGTAEAKRRLAAFLRAGLDRFAEQRNDPGRDRLSGMSPYLHFGQISPLYIALAVSRAGSRSAEAYLEELVVRRELSMNYVFYNARYDSPAGLPAWARRTLGEHRGDRREYAYGRAVLEGSRTHDPCWNAAQTEMVAAGKMHGYMRMYWGKKILEWSRTPEQAFKTALYLNNKYELDGRDPNGFAGVAWCFGKHDRPWGARKIFGNVRYMSQEGLKRKFDIDAYLRRVAIADAARRETE
jgi:deoxyribodipyrimidine photo-lyase